MLEGVIITLEGSNEKLSRDLLRRYIPVQWTKDQRVSQSFKILIEFLPEWYDVIDATSEVNTTS